VGCVNLPEKLLASITGDDEFIDSINLCFHV
jgi:hypothetical protein